MRAVRMTIHNFRNIADATIDLCPYTLLAGANNTGKSNVIAAIRVFYDKDIKYDETRDFPKFPTDDKESWIEIKYRPSTEELVSLKDEYRLPDDTFCVRKYLLTSFEKDDDGKERTGIYAYVGGQLSGSRFYGAKNVQQGKLGEIIYVPAVSKLDEHTKLTGPSALRELINAVLKRVIGTSPAYTDLKKAFDDFGSGLKSEQTQDGQSLDQLESEITEEVAEWGVKFRLVINPLTPDELVKSLVDHDVLDEALNAPQESSAYGQGFQRSLIFALIKLAARYEANPEQQEHKEFSPRLTWILFEEPEAFLHPSQLDTLDKSLRSISESDNSQILITTHNPQFVSRSIEDLPALVRLHRVGARAIARQVDQGRLNSILEANKQDLDAWVQAGVQVQNDDMQVHMESVKYALWLNPLRCGAFFANMVLLVEGPTETALLNRMVENGTITNPAGGVFLFDALGKWNIHRFVNLFGALGIRHAVLYDHDGGKPGDVAIRNTIESARNEYTKIGRAHV